MDNNLTRKLINYAKKQKIELEVLVMALLHVYVYKVNGQKETVIGIKEIRSDNYDLNQMNSLSLDNISSLNIDDTQISFNRTIEKLKNKLNDSSEKIIFFNKKHLLFYISLPFFSDNIQKNEKKVSQNHERNFNYYIELSNLKKEKKLSFCSLYKFTHDLKRYGRAFSSFVDNFLKGSIDRKIKDLELISKKDKKKLLDNFFSFNNQEPKFYNIFQFFEESALRNKEKIALEHKERKISYVETLQKACYIDRVIRSRTKKVQQIAISFLPKEPDLVFAVLGVIRSKNISAMIRPDYPRERVKQIFQRIQPSIFITKKKYLKILKPLIDETLINKKVEIITIDDINIEAKGFPITKLSVLNKDKKYFSNILFTSGSTGNHKAILMKHRSLAMYLNYGSYELIKTKKPFNDIKMLSFFIIEFTGFLRELCITIFRGHTLCFLPDENIRLDAKLLVKWLENNNVNFFFAIPEILRGIFKFGYSSKRLKNLKHLFPGPGNFSKDPYLPGFFKNHPEMSIYTMWGMSEIGPLRPNHKITRADFRKSNMPNFNIFETKQIKTIVVDKDNNILPFGFVGEMLFNSAHSASGYYNDREATKKFFIKNPFSNDKNDIVIRPGDYARILENGDLEFYGRENEQLNVRGVKVFPSEIESYMLKINGVKECNVIMKQGEENDFLVIFYSGTKEINTTKIRNYMKKWLPEYAIPKYFIFLKTLPLLPNGRIDKKAFLKMPIKLGKLKNYKKPGTEIERVIQGIWQEVLGIKNIGINENFFSIGGDSLNIMKIFSSINSLYPKTIKTSTIFKYPTIHKLAKIIEENE